MGKYERTENLINQLERADYNNFAAKTLRILDGDKKDNILISPFSIFSLLSMLAGSTSGETREEILSCVSENGDFESHRKLIGILTKLLEEKGSLSCANTACVRADYASGIKPQYISDLKEYYKGEFISTDNLIDDVNQWVNDKTHGLIEKVADKSMSEIVAFLINAIAFDAKWEKGYSEDDIWEDDFQNRDGTISEVTMLNSKEYSYIENDQLAGFLKPYKGTEYSFMGLLPNEKGSKAIEECLKNIDFTKLYESAKNHRVLVTMPEFKHNNEFDITDFCRSIGINTAFTDSADFSAMSDERLKVEKIIHSAAIELNRHGTKAAAVTAASVVFGSAVTMPEYPILELNRPFIYAIMHNETKLPVFIGVTQQL